ncbi:amidohydrolase [Lentibacillus sp. N15]|uniref:amidohydrolase n=1 Tax=Lentibacillus songyuanensis TaxID=3136161 RepID=UPI0031B9CC02
MSAQDLDALWNYLHAHPEVSLNEVNTTAYLMNHFSDAGFQPVAFKSIPGFYVEIGSGQPKIGLRADMDALLQEVDGKLQANHSCGHDAHMTIVTGVMHRLKKMEDQFSGTVRAIFQPAEEQGNGAVRVVHEGIVDDLDYLFGVHVRPNSEIAFPDCAPGIQHGACLFVKGKINGADHHGARPHEGVNAVEVGTAIVQQLQHIHTNPQIPATIKMTNFHAGNNNLNIIPGNASFGLDVRAQTNDVMDEIKEKIANICKYLEAIYGVTIDVSLDDDVPAAVIHNEAEAIVHDAIVKYLGKQHTRPSIITPGSDDFHYYTILRPTIKATMLALGADVTPGLHHPKMTFNQEAIANGIDILVEACLAVGSSS